MTNTFRSTLIAAAFAALGGPANAQTLAEHPTTPPPPHERQAPAVERNLHTFDTLDFDVFSNQKWERLGESHGHVNLQEYNAYMEVTAITRRKDAILTSILSQVTPSESSLIKRVAYEPQFKRHLSEQLE